MNIKDIRRKNMRALANSIGGITPMAERLGKSQSQISHLIGTKPIKNIGDKIAAQVEVVFNKPHGWMDKEHPELASSHLDSLSFPFNSIGHIRQPVPIISWKQVHNWHVMSSSERIKDVKETVIASCEVSKHAFALRVQGDSMEAPSGISFPEGSIIILDPDHVATNRSFVVACFNESREASLKQLIIDGSHRYLKPLNTRYPIIEISNHTTICGVVRQVLMLF